MTGQEFANALRQIADWYEAHPEVPGPLYPSFGIGLLEEEESPELAERIVRALAPCRKSYSNTLVMLSRDFARVDLRFILYRKAVCAHHVIGTEDVPEHVVPAYTREIVKWDCSPLLTASDAGEGAQSDRTQ